MIEQVAGPGLPDVYFVVCEMRPLLRAKSTRSTSLA